MGIKSCQQANKASNLEIFNNQLKVLNDSLKNQLIILESNSQAKDYEIRGLKLKIDSIRNEVSKLK